MKNYIYYVYIVASHSGVMYVGFTNNLTRRVSEHKLKIHPDSFSTKYNCNKLIFYEVYNDVRIAIGREKQLKEWNRGKKENLVSLQNPQWKEVSILDFPCLTAGRSIPPDKVWRHSK